MLSASHLLCCGRNSVEAQRSGQGGSDSDFERRLSELAQRVPQQPAAEQRQPPAEQRDVLAMSPQFTQPAASPAEDDSLGDRPSWLVQVQLDLCDDVTLER